MAEVVLLLSLASRVVDPPAGRRTSAGVVALLLQERAGELKGSDQKPNPNLTKRVFRRPCGSCEGPRTRSHPELDRQILPRQWY